MSEVTRDRIQIIHQTEVDKKSIDENIIIIPNGERWQIKRIIFADKNGLV